MPETNCFNYHVERACKSCFDLKSQNKTNSLEVTKLKRQPPNEKY